MRKSPNDTVKVYGPMRLVGLSLVLLATTACSGRHTPVPVSGLVTLDGNPLEGATVYFYAVGDDKEGRPAFGYTDKAGRFRLNTLGDHDGALRRGYKVVITKYVQSDPNLKLPPFPNTPEGRAQREDFLYRHYGPRKSPITNGLPVRYGDLNSTPLSCNVTGKTDVQFELTSK